MKFRKLLPFIGSLFLGVAVLAGCSLKPAGSGESELPDDGKAHTLEILNETELQEEWHVGDKTRSLSVKITDDGAEGNIAMAIASNNLRVSSSDKSVLGAAGLVISAEGQGTATLTVSYFKVVKTLEFSIQKLLTPQEKYGTVHSGTEEDPFDNEDAIKVALWAKDNGNTEDFYIKGVVSSFYHAPGSRNDGAVSWFLEPAEGQTEKFEIYKAYKKVDKKDVALTDDDIWKGAEVLAKGPITYYVDGKQAETTSAEFIRITGGAAKPQPKQHLTKTLAEVVEIGSALADGDSAWDLYTFDGYVVKQDGKNYYLASSADAELVQKDYDDKGHKYWEGTILLYGVADAEVAKLLKGAKVTITDMTVKNYHGQIENGTNDYTITVLEPGEAWSYTYTPINVAQGLVAAKALADSATSEERYQLTGKVKAITGAYDSSYGNMSFTVVDADTDTETLTVFRLAVTAAQAETILVGATVVVKGQLQNYVKEGVHTYEFVNGEFVSAEGGAAADVEKATVAEAITAGSALANDGKATSEKKYEITGYVVKNDQKFNFFIADTADADISTNDKLKAATVELYAVNDPATRAKLLKGAKVTVTMFICNYKGTIENSGSISYKFDTATPGEAWGFTYTEANVAESLTAAKALNASANETEGKTYSKYSSGGYKVTGKVKAVTTAYASGKMSFTLVDNDSDTETLLVYNFFTDAETAESIVAGKTIVLQGLLCDFDKYTGGAHVHTYQLGYAEFVSIA